MIYMGISSAASFYLSMESHSVGKSGMTYGPTNTTTRTF